MSCHWSQGHQNGESASGISLYLVKFEFRVVVRIMARITHKLFCFSPMCIHMKAKNITSLQLKSDLQFLVRHEVSDFETLWHEDSDFDTGETWSTRLWNWSDLKFLTLKYAVGHEVSDFEISQTGSAWLWNWLDVMFLILELSDKKFLILKFVLLEVGSSWFWPDGMFCLITLVRRLHLGF